MTISVVDLFCGVGGLTHGFLLEKMKVRAGIDIDPACRFPYEQNNSSKFYLKDVRDLTEKEVSKMFGKSDVKVLAGCAPCQPFSTYAQRYPRSKDEGSSLAAFGELVNSVSPDIVTMENVPRIRTRETYLEFLSSLRKLNYYVTEYLPYCPEYGIPQTRKRLVVFASKYAEISLIQPTHNQEEFVTVRQTIGHLVPIKAGEAQHDDILHCSKNLSRINMRRIKASRPGGTWRDWNQDIVAQCHKNLARKTYVSVYGRMEWDKPAPTLTTQFPGFGNGRFGHPEQDRAISLREGALLQTFPSSYEFLAAGKHPEFAPLGRLIGNAVPINLSRAIAQSIVRHVEVHHGART